MSVEGSPAGSGLGLRPSFIGARAPRQEDRPLLTGTGTYVADIRVSGMVEAAFVRSPVAHMRLTGVELDAARSSPGVLAAVSAADLAGVERYPQFLTYVKDVRHFPLARNKARYVGAPVAVVVAEDRYAAEDAAALVVVDYEELPVVASLEAALAEGAPLLYEDWGDNKIVEARAKSAEVDRLFAELPVFRATYRSQRQSASPMETRGVVAECRHGRLTVWSSAQSPHILRTTLSLLLGLSESRIRVVAPNVGGGFGCKAHQYPEEIVVPWLAMRLGRPVRWIEDRSEHFVSTVHARDQVMEMEAAYDTGGLIRAIRCNIVADVGSGEVFIPGVATPFVSAAGLTGPYRIADAEVSVTCVVTNKTPSGAYRGFGGPEAVFAMERTIERVARLAGADPIETRRRMLLRPEEHPYTLPSGARLDSGSHRAAFDRAVELGEELLAAARARHAGDPHARVGVGYAAYIEPTVPSYHATTGFWTGYDSASVRIEPDGGAVVGVGITAIGQGTETLVASVTADALGIPIEQVTVVSGDTDAVTYGLGAWGSRGAVLASGAVLRAAEAVREKAARIAAHMLEADPADIVLEGGRLHVRGSGEPSVPLSAVATAACVRTIDLPPGMEPGLAATAAFDPPGLEHVPGEDGKFNAAASWTNASHAAVVKVDIRTGVVEVLDYAVVHDCGTVINPVIVEGQIEGGVAQGIAGALYEHLVYDEQGQPLAASFMDYLVPTALGVPEITIEHFETPAPDMPLGAKGMGESGAIGPPGAIADAVADALREFDVDVVETPITPASVRAAIRAASRTVP